MKVQVANMLGLKRDLWLLFALNIAIGFSAQFITPLFPLYLEGLGASEMEIGLVLSLASILATAMMIPSGLMMNRIGKKRTLLVSVGLAALPPLLISFLDDWRWVTPLYMIFSASFSFFIVSRMAMISESATPRNRATLFGVMNLAWPIGGLVAPTLSGFLVENFGWAPIFQVTTLIMAASLIPTLRLEEPAAPIEVEQVTAKRPSIFDREYLPFMTLIFLFHFLAGMMEGMIGTVLPLFLKNQIMISESLIGLFFTASSILILILQIPSGRLADRYGRKKVLVLSLLPIPLLLGAWLFVDDWLVLLVLYAAASGFRSMTWPSSLALLADFIPSELMGSALGVRMMSMRLGSTVAPVLAVYLYSNVGYRSPFLASAALVAMSIVIALAFKEARPKEDEAEAVQPKAQ
ncbi:MFS transporter [Candidatus Bathyarchaeota archaeon]|nr:MAG: MFS transporter [Candidatus Bathyarchaeota archaeon]